LAIGGMIVAMLAMLVSFGLTVAGVQLTKDMHVLDTATPNPNEHALRLMAQGSDGRQHTVAVDATSYDITLAQVSGIAAANLHKIGALRLPLRDGSVHVVHVASVRQHARGTAQLTFYAAGGEQVRFHRDGSIVLVAADGEHHVDATPPTRKRDSHDAGGGFCMPNCTTTPADEEREIAFCDCRIAALKRFVSANRSSNGIPSRFCFEAKKLLASLFAVSTVVNE
jgi:hypothetical protein